MNHRQTNIMLILCAVFLARILVAADDQMANDSLIFGNISIISTAPVDTRLNRIQEKYAGKYVSAEEFAQLTHELLVIPTLQGYHFPILSMESINPNFGIGEKSLNPKFRLNWGEVTIIDTILFQGITKTKDIVLFRTLKPFYGMIYTFSLEEQMDRALRRFPFLTIDGPSEIVMTKEGETGILMTIREQQDNEFIGVAGYVPETYNRKGYFTGELDMKLHNLSGTGRQLFLYWSKTNQYSQQIKINYREPWILRTNLFGTVEFEQILRDTLLVIRDFGFGSGFYSTSLGNMGITLNRESTIPTPGGRLLLDIGNTVTTSIGINYFIDRRNNLNNPSLGFIFSTDIAAGIQKRDLANTITRLEIQFESAGFIPLKKEMVAAVKLNGRTKWLSGEEPGYAEQFWFGGAATLRGYPNDFFRGSRIAWGTLELRRLIGEFSSVYAFFDQGYYFRAENGKTVSGYPSSYGIGIRLSSRMGIIGFDYGFGEGDTFSTAKIHIRLISRF